MTHFTVLPVNRIFWIICDRTKRIIGKSRTKKEHIFVGNQRVYALLLLITFIIVANFT